MKRGPLFEKQVVTYLRRAFGETVEGNITGTLRKDN